ncbi:MBL fold metallo-hydrolase [Paenibacillus cisolokensis]|uniref:MBL fold hydrolase n=1 Tax=Paenibacillus cisolokensis TaxID=1658519 RepID=A0ABQ4MZW6_9BACL|nr:MBL fold metallo-hydrolase [Paenibacillus cisolokensis]GIQ61444.1 MBL fold hydrolase [Paenibacillus cisolokensis]
MAVHIQMIGTGSAFAKRYDNNNALIETGSRTLLLDCGITCPSALYRLGRHFGEIDAVLISHIHGDHVGGLEEYAYQMKYVYKRKPVLYVPAPLVAPLWEHTLKGGMESEEADSLTHYFDVYPLEEGEESELLPGLRVKPLRTRHVPGKISFSYVINGTFFYSADMRFDPDLLERLDREGIRTIFHDCQLHPPGEVHAALPELLTLPERLQEKIWLMHYGDDKEAFEGRTGRMRFVEPHVRYPI